MANFEEYRQAATIYYGDLGAWLYDTWKNHNEKYFNGELKPGALIWGITPYGRSLGFYRYGINEITLHCKYVEPDESKLWQISNLREKSASDVLLHEMVHQKIYQKYGHNGQGISSHNNKYWIAEILRLSPMIGISGIKADIIKQKRIKDKSKKGSGKVTWYVPDGHLTRQELSTWPHCLRPNGYYE